MKKHVKIYYDHFGLGEQDFIYDEYHYVTSGGANAVRAINVHHIEHGSNKFDNITNLMALSMDNHNAAHRETLKRKDLQKIHDDFLLFNPY